MRTIEPHSEADVAALLFQLLVMVGNNVGRSPHFVIEADRHSLNLFLALVGETAKARKGVSFGQARQPVAAVDPAWAEHRIASGLSSGEGLITAVLDSGREGVEDKRLLVMESELASALRVMTRDGNILSAVIRNAWDHGNLRTMVKNNPMRVTEAHVSIIGHITQEELLKYLNNTETANGFANRFLWACARRSKMLPEGGRVPLQQFSPLVTRLSDALGAGRRVGEMRRDNQARTLWHEVYPVLSEGKPSLLGAVTGRAEAQVMRIACMYALLDKSDTIRAEHLEAAIACWDYAMASASYIFGDKLGNAIADKLLGFLRANPNGLTATEQYRLFQGNKGREELAEARMHLCKLGLAVAVPEDTGGIRPAERWYALTPFTPFTPPQHGDTDE